MIEVNHDKLEQQMQQVARLLAGAEQVAALTGAGISVDSGIPDFRGAQGLWTKYDPMEYASIQAFRRDPAKVWRMLLELDELVRGAEPNPAHQALARLEELGRLGMVITQNIDGLHQAAGSRRVVELHGSGRRLICQNCGRSPRRAEVFFDPLPPLCACGGVLKPDVVFFGEMLPMAAVEQALEAARTCQVMLVVGTSALVAPASQLPLLAKQSGATVVEVNLEPTALTGEVADYSLMGGASQVLPRLAELVAGLLEG